MFQHPSPGRVGERKDSLLHEKKDEVWFATSWYKFDFFHEKIWMRRGSFSDQSKS
jgi:hypothetical protein